MQGLLLFVADRPSLHRSEMLLCVVQPVAEHETLWMLDLVLWKCIVAFNPVPSSRNTWPLVNPTHNMDPSLKYPIEDASRLSPRLWSTSTSCWSMSHFWIWPFSPVTTNSGRSGWATRLVGLDKIPPTRLVLPLPPSQLL